MGFLDNSGDIILDAVLTDAGRARLARADGSFQITKFALADDEINYGSYNKSHPSGSAYYDLDIMQTPIFEAFTNNTSVVKFKLQSISRTNLLYLPVIKINNPDTQYNSAYLVTTTTDSATNLGSSINYIDGVSTDSGVKTIILDQGLDTSEISTSFTIDSDLKETQYLIEIDNRFGNLTSKDNTALSLSFIDDDQVASYYVSLADTVVVTDISTDTAATSEIAGPRGTRLEFRIKASIDLNSSTFLFTQLGTTETINTKSFYVINTNVKVTGVSTGYSINVPVKFVRYIS
jgi:hypothetical protein